MKVVQLRKKKTRKNDNSNVKIMKLINIKKLFIIYLKAIYFI